MKKINGAGDIYAVSYEKFEEILAVGMDILKNPNKLTIVRCPSG